MPAVAELLEQEAELRYIHDFSGASAAPIRCVPIGFAIFELVGSN